MPKLTKKYTESLALADHLKLGLAPRPAQDVLYRALSDAGYMWNSAAQMWENIKAEPADPPTPLIRARIWADTAAVHSVANSLVQAFTQNGFTLVERSEPYPCRPPKQLESRIYLSFLPKQ